MLVCPNVKPDAYLQALCNAFQLQSLPSQSHLGTGGAQRQHETGAMVPFWIVYRHVDTR